MKNLQGPCQNCGLSLAIHSKRQMRVCQEAFFEWLNDILMFIGIGATLFKIFHDPKGFEKEVKTIGATYTDAIKALQGDRNDPV